MSERPEPRRIDLAIASSRAVHPEHRALRVAALDAGSVDQVTELAVSGDVVALVVNAPDAPVPVPGQVTLLTFAVTVALPRDQALDRRDAIIRHLRAIGIRPSMMQGTDTALADVGTPTLGDVVTGQADPAVMRGIEQITGVTYDDHLGHGER